MVENDANVAAWGEARFGAGNGQDNVVLLTIGTGVGGGVIIDGRLLRGHFGIGAELGHYRVVPDGLPCGCGQYGCLEQYAAGSALTRIVKAGAEREPERAKILLGLGDGTPDGIVGAHITHAAREGDPIALEGFTEIATWIGQAMADMTAILDPGVFILGGGVSEAGEILAAPARKRYAEQAPATGQRPLAEVVIATLGPDAGIIGAGDLARRSLKAPQSSSRPASATGCSGPDGFQPLTQTACCTPHLSHALTPPPKADRTISLEADPATSAKPVAPAWACES